MIALHYYYYCYIYCGLYYNRVIEELGLFVETLYLYVAVAEHRQEAWRG